MGFAACNDTATESTTTTDSTATTTTTSGPTMGSEIANFSTRTFVDVKTNKPLKLRWNAEKFYYEDETGNQPYYYYDPATSDTFDYWGRRLNSYLSTNNGEWIIDESRWSTENMSNTMNSTDTTTTSTLASGDIKIKAKDDKYKEKTDSTKLKVTDNKIKVKDK